jgi:replicative DNA helicase
VSVADLGSHEREFERTPPHDVAAEQSVLGGMLLSQNAIAEVLEVLRATDFYRPAHQILYDTILDLYGRGEPADAVTIVAELTKRGDINRVGGAPYLHTLMATVPTAANAGYYAKIVRERAVLRKLVEVGTRIVQLGYASEGADADEVLDRAQAEVFAIAEKRTGEDYVPLSEIMPGALDEIEAIGSRGGQMTGVPTGFADLDALTNGLHPGQMVVVAARPAMGKALALDTPLPTPAGWTTMGEVQVGDHLLGADGKPTRVVAATEVMNGRPCYELTFADGSAIVADAEHLWQVRSRSRVLAGAVGAATFLQTTEDIYRAGAADYAVDVAAPFDLPPAALPDDPYQVGRRAVRAIPEPYLRASIAQRRALLAGLRDASGAVRVADRRLAEDALELMRSLGYRASARRAGSGFIVAGRRSGAHEIVGVRPVAAVPVRCVQVSSSDQLYLAGRACIPTHNSTLALDFARAASIRHGLTSAFFSLEMGRNEITMRLLSAEARVALHAMRSGTMQDEDWQRLARRMSEVAEAPLFIDDSPNMSMMEIRAKCRRLKQQHDLRLVIIDYLQLMSSGKRVESRQVEVSEFSRSLKLLAKELGVPVIALSQLNRGPEQRTDKKPMVSDLRESGSIEQDADMVILLHREDAYEKESPRAGEADLIVAKHRNGPTATVTVAFQGHYSRFVDMAQ